MRLHTHTPHFFNQPTQRKTKTNAHRIGRERRYSSICSLWDDGYCFGGVVTKMPSDNKRLCYVEYYDGDARWHDFTKQKFFIVHFVGTTGHGLNWGEITVSKHDKMGLYYEVEYSDGDVEKITDEPESAQLLHELHTAIILRLSKIKRNESDKTRSPKRPRVESARKGNPKESQGSMQSALLGRSNLVHVGLSLAGRLL
jgi:hypothetical protein